MKSGDLIRYRPLGTMARELGLVLAVLDHKTCQYTSAELLTIRVLTTRDVVEFVTTSADFEVIC